jgi:hypothetical protein
MMLKITNKLAKPSRGTTLYCNCQKESCFPCQNSGVLIGETEDGALQLCKACASEYEQETI